MDIGKGNKPKSWAVVGLSALGSFLVIYYFFFSSVTGGANASGELVTKATAYLSGKSPVTGTVTFSQSSENGPVAVNLNLQGLDPLTKRGFHIHQYGDLSDGCMSTGGHYNPYGKTHGARTDSERHVGDLGNIDTNDKGEVNVVIEDSTISLNGPNSILGRAVVVHAGVDDLGKGGNQESLKTGNAGARAACGVIGLV